MGRKLVIFELGVVLVLLLSTFAAQGISNNVVKNAPFVTGEFEWDTGSAVLEAARCGGEDWISVKDPSIVRYKNRWHLFCTVRGRKRSHAVIYLSFDEFIGAGEAERKILSCHEGYFCAPQVFYFEPQKQWYLICQASDESWEPKYQTAYSTTTDISDADSWGKLKPLGAKQADGKSGLDFWIICDDSKAHLFFTTLDGRMWCEETSLESFPGGWSPASLAIQADIFEASHIYRLTTSNIYLAVIEAQGGHGWRYFKVYLSNRLDGEWRPLAAEKDKAFASMRNVHHSDKRWTDSVSHGELIRSGYDQRLEVSEVDMKFLFQGVTDQLREGKGYGEIPWRLGILELRQ